MSSLFIFIKKSDFAYLLWGNVHLIFSIGAYIFLNLGYWWIEMRFPKTLSTIVKQSKFQIAMYEYLQHVYCIFSSALIEKFFLKFHRNISGFVFILLLLNIKSYYMCRVFGRFFENYSLDRSSHYVKSRWETLYV